MAADPGNPYVSRRELDDLLREELATLRRETNEAVRELRDDLHTLACIVAGDTDTAKAKLDAAEAAE